MNDDDTYPQSLPGSNHSSNQDSNQERIREETRQKNQEYDSISVREATQVAFSYASPVIPRANFGLDDFRRLHHPFHNWHDPHVNFMGRVIAHEYGRDDLQDLFEKAARVIQKQDTNRRGELLADLTPSEVRAVKREAEKTFWDQPWPLKTTYFMLFIAAVVQGWSQTGINAANLNWPVAFAVVPDTAQACSPSPDAAWKIAGVNAVTYLVAGTGCWLSDPLNEILFGRRQVITFSAILILASAIGSAVTQNWYTLLGTRILLGVGMGCKASVVPVYAAEIAPDHLRGSLVMNWQVFDAFGIFLGFLANVVASYTSADPDVIWRWQLASLSIPAFALLCGTVFICWDSPRFLMKHERRLRENFKKRREQNKKYERRKIWNTPIPLLYRNMTEPDTSLPYRSSAFEALQLLRGDPLLAAKELIFTHYQVLIETSTRLQHEDNTAMEEEDYSLGSKSKRSQLMYRWFDLIYRGWKVPHVWREARAAATVMLVQQLCGINVLIFYSSSLFCVPEVQPNSNDWRTALWLSLGLGGLNFICAIPAYRWIEEHGRRWLLLTTLPFLTLLLVAASAAAGGPMPNSQTRSGVEALFTYLFVLVYSFGVGPVPFTYSAEIFQLEHRMVGMSWAVSVNFVSAGLLTLFVPIISATRLRATGLLGIFAGLNILAWVLVWAFVPETVGPPIENDRSKRRAYNHEALFYIFTKPMRKYWVYDKKVYRPYIRDWWVNWFRKYILDGKGVRVLKIPGGYMEWLNTERDEYRAWLEQELHEVNQPPAAGQYR